MTNSEKPCEFCGHDDCETGFWNCYEELRPKKSSRNYHFCDNCKSRWVAFARSHGIKFQVVEHYRDYCSCQFENPVVEVRRLWLQFIKGREVVEFT